MDRHRATPSANAQAAPVPLRMASHFCGSMSVIEVQVRGSMKLLILGGTGEAAALGSALAKDSQFTATMSLAGRTSHPAPQSLPLRIGGFGGAEGLARYLTAERIDALVDATHPFAAQISCNAWAAARATGTRLLILHRPEWRPTTGDRWIPVPTMTDAARALGATPRRVFLTIGRQDLAPFRAAPWHHYVVRSVDPPPPYIAPPNCYVIMARGPFDEPGERRLLLEHRIQILVTKNSGGSATVAKLHAARALGLPVVMVARPPPPPGNTVVSVPAVLEWLHAELPPRGA
jgi:precorrin-6A/cobalt-precorrin-6A reductase